MRVCIFGAGAVGGTLAAFLADAGVDVTIVVRDARVAELRRTGIRLETTSRTLTPKVHVAAPSEGMADHDVVILGLKAQSLPAEARALASFGNPGALFVTPQNGVPFWFGAGLSAWPANEALETVDPGGVLLASISREDIAGAVIHFSAEGDGPGALRLNAGRTVRLGVPLPAAEARANAFRDVLENAGFEALWSPSIYRDVWTKLLGNACFNPVSAITGATSDRIAGDPWVRALCSRLMTEVRSIGEAFGIHVAITNDERIGMTERLGAFKTSMLQDLERGRPLELMPMLGAILELAARAHVDAPTVRDVLGLTRLREGSL